MSFRLHYPDQALVLGLQRHNRQAEQRFYDQMRRYFDDHFTQLFFDLDSKEEIFQTALVKLWTEIENGKISVVEGQVSRQQADGQYRPMTASLSTFMITFAKNEFRELLRHADREAPMEINDNAVHTVATEDDLEEIRLRVVDECIQGMSPRCLEIITLFYYQQKSLDEIMALRGDKNSSKDGLKTAKNKCMNTLRERVATQMNRYKIA